jgi:cysteine desulfuration protein SufE
MIDLGTKIPKLDESEKTEVNRVHGCLSTVHMILQKTNDDPPRIEFKAQSDASIVNGLIAILHIVYDGKTAMEMSQINIKDVFAKLGLERHLSINRRNGFFAMVERIQNLIHQIN